MRLNLQTKTLRMTRAWLVGMAAIGAFAGLAAAEPAAFNIVGTEPIAIPSGGQVEITIASSGAGTAYGMSLFLQVSAPFQIDSLIIDQAGSGTVWIGNSTGASTFSFAVNPGIVSLPQSAIGYVTVPGNPISIAQGAIVAKVRVLAPVGTPMGTQGSLTTNSPTLGYPSDWAGQQAGQDTANLAVGACSGSPASDFDRDCDVDQLDFSILDTCWTGSAVPYNPAALPEPDPGCTLTPDGNGHISADFDVDNDVDLDDFGVFQRCYSGENNPADPNCAN